MEHVSDRHAGNLAGKLKPFDLTRAVTVRVVIDFDADTPAVQHTAWMLVNLLARADGIVSRLLISGDDEARVIDGVVPFGSSTTLTSRLVEGANAIGVVPTASDVEQAADRVVIVGYGPNAHPFPEPSWVVGAGWWGGFSRGPAAPADWASADLSQGVPYGPYLAASFAAADIFLAVRDPRGNERRDPATYGWDSWNNRQDSTPANDGPRTFQLDLSDVALAGVGAVGAAWMHAIWATPGLTGTVAIADSDAEGVSTSNLNRGLLFTRSDLEKPKAMAAATAAVGRIAWSPTFGHFEEAGLAPSVLISAVDTNRSRDGLQASYAPRILSGSTRDLRAEVTTVGKPGVGACLRCFNPPETLTSDAEIRARVTADPRGEANLTEIAHALSTSTAELRDRVDAGACDMVTDRMMEMLRDRYGEAEAAPRFAVGFTSCTAGTLLAAATVKLLLGQPTEIDGASLRLNVQFHRPASSVNGIRAYARDSDCPRCAPRSAAVGVWRNRYALWKPTAAGSA